MTFEFLEQAKLGDRRSLARLLSALENGTLHIEAALDAIGDIYLSRRTGNGKLWRLPAHPELENLAYSTVCSVNGLNSESELQFWPLTPLRHGQVALFLATVSE